MYTSQCRDIEYLLVSRLRAARAPGDEDVVGGGRESVLGVLEDVEEDGLHERTAAAHDVVVQPDGARSHAVRVELGGEVVARAQEVRVEHHEEYVQRQDAHYAHTYTLASVL